MDWTAEEMMAAFTEWDRRWQEEPGRFLSESEALAQDPADYGAAATPYFIAILEELRSAAQQ
jgi:hypothetical protein